MTQQATTVDELAFTQPYGEQEQQVLTAEAVEFLTELVTRFTPQRNKLLAARIHQQQEIDDGKLPGFISETASIRRGEWKIRGIPEDLQDRRVEITGPVERKMVINAMNANVKVFMADFEDSLAPDWQKVIDGQINLRGHRACGADDGNPVQPPRESSMSFIASLTSAAGLRRVAAG